MSFSFTNSLATPYSSHLSANRLTFGQIALQLYSSMVVATSVNRMSKTVSEHIDLNFQNLRSSLNTDIQRLNNTINLSTKEITSHITSLSNDIKDLASHFDMAIGQVVSTLYFISDEYTNGIQQLALILSNPNKIQAKEHFYDGLELYFKGTQFIERTRWFKDSLKHLLASVELYENNPYAHFLIAHIYHFIPELQNFIKSLDHYTLAYTYSEATGNSMLTAQSYLYAGWMQAVLNQDYDEAISLTTKALEYDNNLDLAKYNLAKFYSLINIKGECLEYLKELIQSNYSEYCDAIISDADFDFVRDAIVPFEKIAKPID